MFMCRYRAPAASLMKYCWCPAFAALLPAPYADSNLGPASSGNSSA